MDTVLKNEEFTTIRTVLRLDPIDLVLMTLTNDLMILLHAFQTGCGSINKEGSLGCLPCCCAPNQGLVLLAQLLDRMQLGNRFGQLGLGVRVINVGSTVLHGFFCGALGFQCARFI